MAVIGLVLLKLSLNVLAPRQWALQQALTDAYLTYERSWAERIPFERLTRNDSPWPAYPNISTETVEVGRLPGGRVVNGVVTRTRVADPTNAAVDGGSGTMATNPAGMVVWRAQSVLRFEVGGRSYLKSRTVIRIQ